MNASAPKRSSMRSLTARSSPSSACSRRSAAPVSLASGGSESMSNAAAGARSSRSGAISGTKVSSSRRTSRREPTVAAEAGAGLTASAAGEGAPPAWAVPSDAWRRFSMRFLT